MNIMKLVKKQDGAALVMVMIIFMVVAVLGSIVITLSSGEIKQSVALDKDMRAYYQARSAADSTTYWIRNQLLDLYEIEYAYNRIDLALDTINNALTAETLDPDIVAEKKSALNDAVNNYDSGADLDTEAEALNKISDILNMMTHTPVTGTLDPDTVTELNGYLSKVQLAYNDAVDDHDTKQSEFEVIVKPTAGDINTASISSAGNDVITDVQGVEVQRKNLSGVDYIYSRATATVYNESSSAVVRLKEQELRKIVGLFCDAIYAAKDISIAGNAYEVTGGNVSYGGAVDGVKHDNIDIGPNPNNGDVYPDWNPLGNLEKEVWPTGHGLKHLEAGYYEGVCATKGNYEVDATGGDVYLHIEKLDATVISNISVKGPGNVYIFIDELVDPKIQISIDSGVDEAYVYLIFDESVSNVEWTGTCIIEAYIYAPEATVDIGGNTKIYGAVITNNYINTNGNFEVHYRYSNIDLDDFVNNSDDGKMKQWLKENQW